MRRTKIVCTIGPASNSPEVARQLVDAGMNIARLNFSHGSHEMHRANYDMLRSVARETNRNLGIMMDLQGPKIRTGTLANGEPVTLVAGASFLITTRDIVGDANGVSTSYTALPGDVHKNDRILMSDGILELCVESVDDEDVHCTVVRGGLLGEHKGINLPGVAVSSPALTPKDAEDLEFGLELGVDYVALSFVRGPADIHDIKARIEKAGKDTKVVAKIERPEALDCFDEILAATDIVMVARGDLGVEVPLAEVPQIQKDLIQRCDQEGVPVITATQMLESMCEHGRPTRAEAADVANAIYDGTDAVMLSGETAAGQYPVEAVRTMADIASKADDAIAKSPDRYSRLRQRARNVRDGSFSQAIGQAVCRMSETLELTRIVCFTGSGHTARSVSHFRPRTPIVAVTMDEAVQRRCAMYWGVEAFAGQEVRNVDEMIQVVDSLLLESGQAQEGDTVVIVAGTPLGIGGRTNLLKLHIVGDKQS